jgi:hypothetical protein
VVATREVFLGVGSGWCSGLGPKLQFGGALVSLRVLEVALKGLGRGLEGSKKVSQGAGNHQEPRKTRLISNVNI